MIGYIRGIFLGEEIASVVGAVFLHNTARHLLAALGEHDPKNRDRMITASVFAGTTLFKLYLMHNVLPFGRANMSSNFLANLTIASLGELASTYMRTYIALRAYTISIYMGNGAGKEGYIPRKLGPLFVGLGLGISARGFWDPVTKELTLASAVPLITWIAWTIRLSMVDTLIDIVHMLRKSFSDNWFFSILRGVLTPLWIYVFAWEAQKVYALHVHAGEFQNIMPLVFIMFPLWFFMEDAGMMN